MADRSSRASERALLQPSRNPYRPPARSAACVAAPTPIVSADATISGNCFDGFAASAGTFGHSRRSGTGGGRFRAFPPRFAPSHAFPTPRVS